MKASVSLIGTCVSDNVFYYSGINGKNQFLVKNRIFQVSPVSIAIDRALDFANDFSVEANIKQYSLESIKSDISKNFFERLKAKKSDYLILDMFGTEFDIVEINYNNEKYYITYSNEFLHVAPSFFEWLKEKNIKYSILKMSENIDFFDHYMELFCKKILSLYSPEKIILIEAMATNYTELSDGTIDIINVSNPPTNQMKLRAYEIIKKEIKGCKVIPALDNAISSYVHFQRINKAHFMPFVYDYYYDCIEACCDYPDDEFCSIVIGRLMKKNSTLCTEHIKGTIDKLIDKERNHRRIYSFNRYRFQSLWHDKGTYLCKINRFYDRDTPAQTEIHKITDFCEYLKICPKLIEDGNLIIVSACEGIGTYAPDTFRKLFPECEITDNKYNSFIAVLGQQTNFCKTGSYKENIMIDTKHCDDFENEDINAVISVYSKGREYVQNDGEFNCWSKIVIDNIDYSMNLRGLNFVIYNKITDTVVDVFNVDTFTEHLNIRR